MGVITQSVLVQAAIDVNRMSQAHKVSLADEIFVHQPNLLTSILVLPRMGVGMVQLEVPLHILMVGFQAMKHSGHAWPIVTEDIQEATWRPGSCSSSATNIVSASCWPSSTATLATMTCWPREPSRRSP